MPNGMADWSWKPAHQGHKYANRAEERLARGYLSPTEIAKRKRQSKKRKKLVVMNLAALFEPTRRQRA